jgi:hypothetical protein
MAAGRFLDRSCPRDDRRSGASAFDKTHVSLPGSALVAECRLNGVITG